MVNICKRMKQTTIDVEGNFSSIVVCNGTTIYYPEVMTRDKIEH